MKMDHLSYKVEWIKGANNNEANALSRAPSSTVGQLMRMS